MQSIQHVTSIIPMKKQTTQCSIIYMLMPVFFKNLNIVRIELIMCSSYFTTI